MLGNLAVKNLAWQYNLSERWVWDIVNRPSAIPEAENNQEVSLFT